MKSLDTSIFFCVLVSNLSKINVFISYLIDVIINSLVVFLIVVAIISSSNDLVLVILKHIVVVIVLRGIILDNRANSHYFYVSKEK